MSNDGLEGYALFRHRLMLGSVQDPTNWTIVADEGDYWHAVVRKDLSSRVHWLIGTLEDPDQIRPSVRQPERRRSYLRSWENQFGQQETLLVVVQAIGPNKAKLHTAFLLEDDDFDTYCKGEVWYERD